MQIDLLYIFILYCGATIPYVIHNIYSSYYCKKKHEKNNKSRCPFWDCPNYNFCEYNYNESGVLNDKFNR